MPVNFLRLTKADFLSKNNLFKFMPLENALMSLKGEYLWLANPTQWEDPFEKRFVTASYKDKIGAEKPFGWLGRIFCICFTQTVRSEAYWSVYSRKNIGIQFTIDRKQLLDELDDFCNTNGNFKVYIGKVEYMKASDIKLNLSDIPMKDKPKDINGMEFKARLLLLKRKDFEYENEIRVIVVKQKATSENGIKLPVRDLDALVRRITIDPSVGDFTTEVLRNYFTKEMRFTPIRRNTGDFYRVTKSNLYKNNQSNVTIKI